MIKSIQYLDLKAVFQMVSRRHMLHSLGQHDPDLATVFSRWYTGTTTHRMHHDGSHAHIQASTGIDQGCPLSPCGFCCSGCPISRHIFSETQRTPHPRQPSCGRSWTSRTSGSCSKTSQPPSTWHRAPPAPHTSSCSPPRFRYGQPLALHQPHPTRYPGQSQTNTEVPGRTLATWNQPRAASKTFRQS